MEGGGGGCAAAVKRKENRESRWKGRKLERERADSERELVEK